MSKNISKLSGRIGLKDNLFQKFKIQGPELITYQNLFLGRLKKFKEMNNLD